MTDFTLATAKEILAAVKADKSAKPTAINALAGRVLRAKPRAPSVDAFCALVGLPRYATVRGEGPEDYRAWIAAAQAKAKSLGAKPSARATRASGRKASAKTASRGKRTASPKAKGGTDIGALLKAAGVDPAKLGLIEAILAS